MSEAKCFHLSRGGSCELPSCDCKRVELQVVDWSGCDGTAREESFDVSTWTPEQFQALRAFIAAGCGQPALPGGCNQDASATRDALPIRLDDLKLIENRPLRVFHMIHSIFGPEEIQRFYSKHTIRLYRQRLRAAGFDYPRRSVPTGPRQPPVARDLTMGPSRARRSKGHTSNTVL